MGLFATTNTVEVDVGDGFIVTLKREMDAGLQEDLDAEHTRLRQGGASQEFVLHNSRLLLVRLMIVSITFPDGRVVSGPVSDEDARKFDRYAFARLINQVETNNPPFNLVRATVAAKELGIEVGPIEETSLTKILAESLAEAQTEMTQDLVA